MSIEKEDTNREEAEEGLMLKVLYFLDAQWVKIDDVIAWAKKNDMYDVTKEFIKLKNQKPL